MAREQRDYASFLLRLWRSQEGGRSAWRVSLDSTETGERKNFATLRALLAFLNSQFGDGGPDHETSNLINNERCD